MVYLTSQMDKKLGSQTFKIKITQILNIKNNK